MKSGNMGCAYMSEISFTLAGTAGRAALREAPAKELRAKAMTASCVNQGVCKVSEALRVKRAAVRDGNLESGTSKRVEHRRGS